MSIISVSNLTKYYQINQKEPGFVGSLKSLVSKKYETVKAVNDISFEIQEGELVGFIGPNGAGKTTTLKCLSGLLYPTGGKISVLGYVPYNRENKFLKQIALVMGQKNQLWWDLPAMETFLLNKEVYEIPDIKFNEIIHDLAQILDVKDLLKVQVRKLSLGERMKCELIAALIHSPRMLFLDEPTIGLDVVMQKKLREFIKEYNIRYNATIILTSHYMGDVQALCKRVIIINFGKILFDGLLSDLIKQHAPYKVISVTFKEKVDINKINKLGDVKDFNYPEMTLRVQCEDSNRTAAKILRDFPVDDVNIEDPDMEDVIRKVFSNKE